MKKAVFFLTIILAFNTVNAQITTTKVAEKKEEISTTPYDSLQNFLAEDVRKYIGQDLYLKGKSESLRKFGYSKFLLNYQYKGSEKDKNIYKCCDSYSSKYDALNGKYFNVVSVIKHPKAAENKYLYGAKFYLELNEKESGDKVYFEYNASFKSSFPFIVVGFFEKAKSTVVGQKFVFNNRVLKSSTDINTGDSLVNTPNQKWECTDLTIEEKYYSLSLIIKNSVGQSTDISYSSVFGIHRQGKAYTEKEANLYEQKFGKSSWLTILNREIVVGFTEEMVLLSWGKPKKINRASSGDQWVYDGQYVYFENGKMTSFN